MFGVDLSDIDIDGRDPNGNYPDYDTNYHRRSCEPYEPEPAPTIYPYKFTDLEHLMTSKFFQQALTAALAHKDREIESLRNELLALSTQ